LYEIANHSEATGWIINVLLGSLMLKERFGLSNCRNGADAHWHCANCIYLNRRGDGLGSKLIRCDLDASTSHNTAVPSETFLPYTVKLPLAWHLFLRNMRLQQIC
jgi:hypothetical protein